MTTNTALLAESAVHGLESWHTFWGHPAGLWIRNQGLHIVLLIIGAMLASRFVSWIAQRITRHLDERFDESDALVRSEATKHRQTVASVIRWVFVVLIAFAMTVQVGEVLRISLSGFVAPATVVGAALGFGAQQMVKDLLSGIFVITERQYGFGDLVRLTLASGVDAYGTVENVTLRVSRLRATDGQVFIVPNGQIIKAANLSKDWARAVVDIPVATSADLNRVSEVLEQECQKAQNDPDLKALLLGAPALMGLESISVDTVTLRLAARTLPGKQFEVSRLLRLLVIRGLARAGIVTAADENIVLNPLETIPTEDEPPVAGPTAADVPAPAAFGRAPAGRSSGAEVQK